MQSKFNTKVLSSIMDTQGLSLAELAARIGIPRESIENELNTEEGPSRKTIKAISAEVALPTFFFYMSEPPSFDTILPDFRSARPVRIAKSKQALQAIQFARSVQKLSLRVDVGAFRFPRMQLRSLDRPETADSIRRELQIKDQDQLSSASDREFYQVCRRAIERSGVIVLHDSFPVEDGSGFCFAHNHSPVILINTSNQNVQRRTFTLIHEFAHALIGESGISDPFKIDGEIERVCNTFAGNFLAPKHLVLAAASRFSLTGGHPSREQIKRAAAWLRISQQATLMRFELFGCVPQGSMGRWLQQVSNLHPDFIVPRGGKGGDEIKKKLATYGTRAAIVFEKALKERILDPIELYRATGLKPRWYQEYFELARSLHAIQSRD